MFGEVGRRGLKSLLTHYKGQKDKFGLENSGEVECFILVTFF